MSKIAVRQQLLLISLVLLVLIVFVGIVFFPFNGSNTNEQKASVIIHTKNTPQSVSRISPTVYQKNTYTYTGKNYEATFPIDWTEDTSTLNTTQGTMLYLQPSAKADNSAHVAVEINNAKDVSLDNMSAGLSFLGLKKVNTVVSGTAAQKFSGTVTLSQKVLHNTIYLFSYNDQIYMIKLSYVGSNDPQLEQQFTEFVNSFKFN